MILLKFTTTKTETNFKIYYEKFTRFTRFTKTQSKKIVVYHISQIQKVKDQKFTILTKPIFGQCGKTSE
jgi:hypothetical protein